MERVVNGHYADPQSTRSIIGITPSEFEQLISLLQFTHEEIGGFFGLDVDLRRTHLKNVINDNLPDGLTFDQIPTEQLNNYYTEYEQNLADKYAFIYKLLTALNQPYPGASYPG